MTQASVSVRLFCSDFKFLGEGNGIDRGCCGSCHDDQDEGYEMIYIDVYRNIGYVCCTVSQRIDEYGKDRAIAEAMDRRAKGGSGS